MSLLNFQNVSYRNGDNLIIKNLSLEIDQGDFISIVGPSGSGKSTFLKLCCNLISTTSGMITYKDISINDYCPTQLRKKIAYCFQTPLLFGDTVMDNIKFPFTIRNLIADEKRISTLFTSFHLPLDLLSMDVKKLSGGEKQRIALIRSLLFKPDILLLDEITSALDMENSKITENIISSLNYEGVTVLWVTHNLVQSREHANKLVTMGDSEIRSLEVLR